ncbi:hypothetical protein HCN44_001581 [Aphidius gifuensis]|uniref:Transcription factor IIIC 90kDa subunit N-terminal domain-containing protein n=1 Tax=Aphidius gifuensis TaxID=684658 RepID=A0A834XU49_APHGI|nr:uncharacterized protein LOC122853233 [Aphidius gifuensis]KAF7992256.1 hypothetical protein HCN44_001581 [Aphidius gifuensis]
METVDVCSVNVSELVTSSFCANWSEDNNLSIITEKGVHVFELQPNPLCPVPMPKFKRSFMYPTDNLPTEILLSDINNQLNTYSKNEFYSLMMDSPLTPKIYDKADHIPRIITSIWSPIKLAQPSKCLLATLTSAGAVDLLFKSGKNWFSICNISTIWLDIIKNKLESIEPNKHHDAVTFRNEARKLQATSIAWSTLQQSSNKFYCYFLTSFRSGDLVIWRIDQIPELSFKVNATMALNIQVNQSSSTTSTAERITKLCWITLANNKHVVIVGYFDGRIHGIELDDEPEIMTEISRKKYIDSVDKMPVTSIQSIKLTNGNTHVVVTKNFFIISLILNENGDLIHNNYIKIMGFSITGLVIINETETIITTQNGGMHFIKLNEQSKLTSSQINNESISKSLKVQYRGLACSPSKATFINVTSPNCQHDHLINREPSILQLFHLNIENMNPWLILNSSECNFNIHWDCLEVIRIKAAKSIEPEDVLPIIDEELETMSIHKLRITMWMTLITKVLKKKKILKKIDNIVGEISEAQPLIFVNSVSSYLLKLIDKNNLNDYNRLSMHFLRLYLEVYLAGEDDTKNTSLTKENITVDYAINAVKMTSNMDLIEVEACNLCGEIITELPWIMSNCPKGHKLPRCALTLLQITCLRYKSCPTCGRLYHPSLDDDYDQVRCIYCDIPAIYDPRIIGVDDDIHENCKNLSVKPIWEIQASKIPQEI